MCGRLELDRDVRFIRSNDDGGFSRPFSLEKEVPRVLERMISEGADPKSWVPVRDGGHELLVRLSGSGTMDRQARCMAKPNVSLLDLTAYWTYLREEKYNTLTVIS